MIAILTQAYVPNAAAKLLDILAVPQNQRDFSSLATRLIPGTALPAPQVLFPRYVEEGETPAKA